MIHPKAGRPTEARPVKYIAAILHPCDFDLQRGLLDILQGRFGRVDYHGSSHPFEVTDYYEDEMGRNLCRTIVSFEPLRSASELVRAKLAAAEIENSLAEGGRRRVNVDIGYMDLFKVVLASFKEGPQKIYLGVGVYADPVLLFQNGAFKPLEWTFPDFKSGIYSEELAIVREAYKEALRKTESQRRKDS